MTYSRTLHKGGVLVKFINFISMGKRKIEKIQLIENLNHRKVTYCKRKKGLLKKAVELSVLCDVSTFVFVFDKTQKRCVHFASDP